MNHRAQPVGAGSSGYFEIIKAQIGFGQLLVEILFSLCDDARNMWREQKSN